MCLCLFVKRLCSYSFCLLQVCVCGDIFLLCGDFFFHSAPVGFVSGGLKKGAYEEEEEKKSGKRMHTHYAHTLCSTHYSFTHTDYAARTQAQSNATTHTPNTTHTHTQHHTHTHPTPHTHTQHHTHTHSHKKARSLLHTLTHCIHPHTRNTACVYIKRCI